MKIPKCSKSVWADKKHSFADVVGILYAHRVQVCAHCGILRVSKNAIYYTSEPEDTGWFYYKAQS